MRLGARARSVVVRLNARHSQRLLLASVITLVTSAILLGLIGAIRWRGRQALQSDTHAVITQAAQQLVRLLQSRRGTLTFLRDTLNRQADLSPSQLHAMGESAVDHTRHLLGVGLIRIDQPPEWWASSPGLLRTELAQLNRAIVQRTALRGVWRVPSTFVPPMRAQQPLVVMLEPLRGASYRSSALMGVFDVKSLLEEFVTSGPWQPYPIQVLDDQTQLYHSPGWQPTTDAQQPLVMERAVVVDAARWMLQMQPGTTRVVQTLSWLNVLVTALGVIAGLGVIIIVWMLAARTWILQGAVARRTAALRRTMGRLRQLAVTDELTGLYNRRFFLDRWEWECERAKRYQRPLACLMIDVNGFKQVNDRLGHHVGDLVLQQVARELKLLLRQSDILARFGGDEFIIALPETSLAQAESVADKLRQISIPVPDAQGHRARPVSLSVGMSRVQQPDESPLEILQAADQSLYAWKRRMKASLPPLLS